VLKVLDGVRVRHVRQSACPARFADVVVDVQVSPGTGRSTVTSDGVVAVPVPLPEDLLEAFAAGAEHEVGRRPEFGGHDVTVVLRQVVWHEVDSSPRSFQDVAKLVVDHAAQAFAEQP
jgi:hypothetical protein